MQQNTNENKYTFELKDLSYEELIAVYKDMLAFIDFLKKELDNAVLVKDKESGKGENQ